MPSSYLEIFFIGLLGSMHCIGMCGGFVAMYSFRKPAVGPSWPHHLLYNLGRGTTYSLLGGAFGYVGSFLASAGRLRGVPGAVLLFAGLMMVAMGLNMAGGLGKRGIFEETGIIGTSLFRRTLHRIFALESVWGTFLLGLLLGLLPCGLLYPIFMNAAASGSVLSGASALAVFALGTVPALMSFGFLITRVKPRLKLLMLRTAAALIVLLGLRTFLRGMAYNGWISLSRFW